MKYGVQIIGCGNKGALADAPGTGNEHKYLSYAHAVTRHTGFELAGFGDKDHYKQWDAEEIWGQGYGKADVLVIATPDNFHFQYLMEALKGDHKLVICEKPLCMDFISAELVVEKYEKAGIPLLVDYTRRFIPEYRQMKSEIDAGKWGQYIEGYGYFNRGWMHTASHMIDFVLWMKGSLNGFKIKEIPTEYRWIYQIGMFFEKDFFSDHAVNFVKNPNVSSIYDKHLLYVMDNAYRFLEGEQELFCTGRDALKTIEATEKEWGKTRNSFYCTTAPFTAKIFFNHTGGRDI
jgi:hypothetical protein